MGKILRILKAFWRGQPRYAYPAQDINVGDSEFHLVGSIHMGTQGMMPLPAALQARLARADALIVEADITSGASPFGESEICPPLSTRLTAEELCRLERLCETVAIAPEAIDTLSGWQIALMLQAQQAQRLGLRTEYGIDMQLLNAARAQQKQVIELEGPAAQLALLQALPDNGLSLLRDTLEHWDTNARLLQTMMSWWLERPPRGAAMLPSTFNNALNDVLMLQRNQRWSEMLPALPAGNYVVAVGALHLYGDGNLPELLKNNG
ncbi:TraB/GumN family protein [Erwinia sp. 9145]|uniref:TraB/GumN family protein n=1 Tax=Erwinia sp. 9145 TaxID=1500895 RepID=UPI00054CE9BB|nr:TraB/GumN family protein [Erwinia sp. 9145]